MILTIKETPRGKEPKMSGEILVGKEQEWEIAERLDSGGNGIIYKLKNDDGVLAKVFKYGDSRDIFVANRKTRFLHEIQFLEKYGGANQHMPVLFDKSIDDEKPFFVMKKYHDIHWLYSKALSYEEKLNMCLQLLDAIIFVHSTGTAHRDIKPKNLLFEEKDGVSLVLTDYGLISSDDLDSPGDRLGSFGFTPPELRYRNEETDNYFPSDVYEFAKTVYAFLSGVTFSFSDGISIIGQENEIRTKGDSLFLEPIYEMIEKAIKYDMEERIDVEKCKEYIQLSIGLLQTRFSTEWNEKREFRRIVSLLANKASHSVNDSNHISMFISNIVNGKYDIEINNKRLFVNKIVEKSLPNDGRLYYELHHNSNEQMSIFIEQLIIPRSFDKEYDIFIRRVGVNFSVSNNLEKCKIVRKGQNEKVNDFRI